MQNNFKYLDDLIHSGAKEIVLDLDIVLGDGEESEYPEGIKLDVNNLIIDGNGHEIDAGEKTRIFHCTGKNIAIKNLTLKNGYAGNGAAIYNDADGLTISDCTLANNIAYQGHAGAISNVGGGMTIIESVLTANRGPFGGAIYNNDELTIIESVLTANTSPFGGAIFNDRGKLTIMKSSLMENMSHGMHNEGGAIFALCGELTIIESSFAQNASNDDGGAIGNDACRLTIFQSTFAGNAAKKYGGAIYNDRGKLTIAESSFAGNTNYGKSTATAKITVKKATPKLTAAKKTFKKSVKTKKYIITLKDNRSKAINKAKVTLKVNGKTYKATTNKKGKATFKITKLTKKGKHTATVTFKGDKYYNKATKKVKITIK